MITPTRERRDWTLLVFIIPIGIIFMLIAGQVAIRLVPAWSVNAGMQSNLDPNSLPNQQSAPVQPILPAILTPLGWLDTFLTPGAGSGDNSFPPFIIFEPSATPEVTNPPPTVSTQPSPTAPTPTEPTVIVSPPVTGTKPPDDEEPPPPPTATQPTPTATGTPSIPPAGSIYVPPPANLGVDVPPDGNAAGLPSLLFGSYTIVDLGSNPVQVSGTPDGNYDLIFYESDIGSGSVYLDQIIIGVSNATDGSYYEVFNWGDNDPEDTNENTNVDTTILPADPTCTGANAPECDNRIIPVTVLYADPVSGISTGILIDVDAGSGAPPADIYNYLVIISPATGDFDPAQVDAVVVAEVPGGKSGMSALEKEEPALPVEESSATSVEASDLPAEDFPESPPADEVPSSPEDEAPAPPAEEPPSTP